MKSQALPCEGMQSGHGTHLPADNWFWACPYCDQVCSRYLRSARTGGVSIAAAVVAPQRLTEATWGPSLARPHAGGGGGGTVRSKQPVSLAAMLTRSEPVRNAGLRGRVTLTAARHFACQVQSCTATIKNVKSRNPGCRAKPCLCYNSCIRVRDTTQAGSIARSEQDFGRTITDHRSLPPSLSLTLDHRQCTAAVAHPLISCRVGLRPALSKLDAAIQPVLVRQIPAMRAAPTCAAVLRSLTLQAPEARQKQSK